MALKVVPAGDERCDIHNGRRPAAYICKDCLKELGVEAGATATVRRGPLRRARRTLRRPTRPARRAARRLGPRTRRRILIGAGIMLATAAVVLIVVLVTQGGGGGGGNGLPSEAEVVDGLDLSPDPSGTGWITLDGACAVLSISIGPTPQPAPQTTSSTGEATNEDGTVRAVVQNAFSQSQAACVDRINAALRDHF